jgi:chromosome segregation ATPase
MTKASILKEISQKQKEFCTMYEVVKNERNKYTTHIQKSSQHLSEMKEKLKILQNEVEILKMESAFKDKKLQNIKQEAQSLKTIHDNLQNQKTSIGTKNRVLHVQVEQSVIETDKLNSIINAIEKEMVKLRREYEQGVETRNFTGTQLIDRNDELCILWEKSNILEKLLKKGESAMLSKNEEIRGFNIDLKEVERQLVVVQKKIPEIPKLVDEHVRMRAQVDNVRKRTDELSKELENPDSHLRRWQKLKGEDLDADSLRKKIQDLEERLHTKNEALLEKELIHEEVTALSEKLRQQALAGRQGTMDLSQKVNTFQSRIKDVTRKMMATVSELSMYQATSHKLHMERDEICEKAVTARERLSQGMPPTDAADAEFDKMMQVEAQKEVDRQASAQRKQEEEIMNSNYTRTTAEPRVNAYIPEDDRGLPKAYGNNAPFKPTVCGSSMRHTRKPNPKQIEI